MIASPIILFAWLGHIIIGNILIFLSCTASIQYYGERQAEALPPKENFMCVCVFMFVQTLWKQKICDSKNYRIKSSKLPLYLCILEEPRIQAAFSYDNADGLGLLDSRDPVSNPTL